MMTRDLNSVVSDVQQAYRRPGQAQIILKKLQNLHSPDEEYQGVPGSKLIEEFIIHCDWDGPTAKRLLSELNAVRNPQDCSCLQ